MGPESIVMTFLLWVLIRTIVFGVALTLVTRRSSGVKVSPRAALPLVALVFAILNSLLYMGIATFVTWASLFTLSLVAPFLANAALLLLTDKLVKPLKIEDMWSLLTASFTITCFHLALRLIDWFL